jgi:hypothetical protein
MEWCIEENGMNSRRIVLAVIILIVAGAAALGWYRFVAHPTQVTCGYCNRPLHANSMVTAEIAGKRTQVCCARCAISEANQQHKPVRLIEVHDYRSGRGFSPDNAWFVEGSRVTVCEHDMANMSEHKDMPNMVFDRCSPGTLAFASKPEADAFVIQNGGTVIAFNQLMSEARYQ